MKKIVFVFFILSILSYAETFIKETEVFIKDGKTYSLVDDKEISGVLIKEKDGLTYYSTYDKGIKIKERILNTKREVVSEYTFDSKGLISGNVMYSDNYGVSTEANYTKGIINGYAKANYYEDLDYEGNFSFGVTHGKIKFLDVNYLVKEKNVNNGKIEDKTEKFWFTEYFLSEFVNENEIKIENSKAYKNKTLFTGFAFKGNGGYVTSGTFYNSGEKKAYFEFAQGFMTKAIVYNKNNYVEYKYLSFGFVQGMLYTLTNYVNGIENGAYVTYYEDGWRFEGNFKEGKLFGKGTYFDETNRLREIHDYLNDKYTATLYFDYDKNIVEGKVQGEKINGEWVKTGKAIYYTKDGKLDEEIEYNGSKGYTKLYYPNGKIEKEGYVDSHTNLYVGEIKEYYENGNLKAKLNYVDGYLNGQQFYYDLTGKETKVENYDYGYLIEN